MRQASCLMVIDAQEGVFNLKRPVYNKGGLVENINLLLNWARVNNTRVYFSQHENSTFLKRGSASWEIVDGLTVDVSDVVINKDKPGIFEGTQMHDRLKAGHISTIYVSGLISNGCVKDTCLDALKYGFDVVLVADAHSTFYANAEKVIHHINEEIEKAGGTVIPTESLLRT